MKHSLFGTWIYKQQVWGKQMIMREYEDKYNLG